MSDELWNLSGSQLSHLNGENSNALVGLSSYEENELNTLKASSKVPPNLEPLFMLYILL